GTVLISVWFKVVKWHMLLLPTGNLSKSNLFYAINVGYLVSTVLPGRLGELARAYMLARVERVSPVAVLSTVALDRVLDVVAMALLLAVVLPTTDLPPQIGQSGFLIGAGGVAVLAVCMALAYPAGRELFLRLLRGLPKFPGKPLAEHFAEALCDGMSGLRGAGAVMKIALATLGVWLTTVVTAYGSMQAFHISAPIWAAALVVAITNLGMAVPSTPGYFGVSEYLTVLALSAFGVDKESALGCALIYHLAWIVPVNLLGVFAMWRFGMSLMGWQKLDPEDQGDPAAVGSGK
ncbi:MAG TPA: lysylphosphatidylglycerol synthase transmembrane domain-containing protein, partial [Chloroflexota bacterium]|nr:lysylphosphatidylglycerol synthase transmembrane domain-containing protein [Chloroflexota bacterium]